MRFYAVRPDEVCRAVFYERAQLRDDARVEPAALGDDIKWHAGISDRCGEAIFSWTPTEGHDGKVHSWQSCLPADCFFGEFQNGFRRSTNGVGLEHSQNANGVHGSWPLGERAELPRTHEVAVDPAELLADNGPVVAGDYEGPSSCGEPRPRFGR